MATSFKQRLAALKRGDAWSKAVEESKTGGFSSVPDGKYIVLLSGARVDESQSSGRLQVVWEYTVTDGDQTGQTVRDFDGLDKPENLPWLFRKLARFGVDVDTIDPEQIEDILDELVQCKITLRITCKTKESDGQQGYQNVYIDRVLSQEAEFGTYSG